MLVSTKLSHSTKLVQISVPVSYTHLDVYKRQGMTTATQLTLQKKFADEHLKGGQYFWRVISATATSASRAQSKTVSKVGQFLR